MWAQQGAYPRETRPTNSAGRPLQSAFLENAGRALVLNSGFRTNLLQNKLMKKKTTYRVTFHNQGKLYENYARNVNQSGLMGFVEVEDILFGEKSTVVVDPTEENLKAEFAGVSRTYIPMHAVVRIDVVEKSGQSKVTEVTGGGDKVMPFPVFTPGPGNPRS